MKLTFRYKFKDKEKFNGQSYCTLHNELCEDLSFACDTNCQIYEDYKQLKRKEEECEELKGLNTNLVHLLEYEFNRIIKLRKCLQEIKELAEAITNGTHFSDNVEEHLKEMVNKIIEKINEVEDVSIDIR